MDRCVLAGYAQWETVLCQQRANFSLWRAAPISPGSMRRARDAVGVALGGGKRSSGRRGSRGGRGRRSYARSPRGPIRMCSRGGSEACRRGVSRRVTHFLSRRSISSGDASGCSRTNRLRCMAIIASRSSIAARTLAMTSSMAQFYLLPVLPPIGDGKGRFRRAPLAPRWGQPRCPHGRRDAEDPAGPRRLPIAP